ncbi:MAG: AmmeMemoRadiSam system protein B [Phycisphaerae bacterium]|nr:AmmeMemoRadiSam system protein B [Phycisphaerae bacterium]
MKPSVRFRRFAGILVVAGVAWVAGPTGPSGAAEATGAKPSERVHACTGAGQWFPADAKDLRQTVDGFLAGGGAPTPQPPVALIAPHAGYPYAGAVTGKGYAALKGRTYKRVILLGPSHQAAVRGASVLRVDAYETPLGRILVDAAARDALLRCAVVREQPAAHAGEWSVENQLPFLQVALGDFAMVEVLVGVMTPTERATLARVVRNLANAETLLVVSTDFCHYGPRFNYVPFTDRVPERLAELNDRAVAAIRALDAKGWDRFIKETGDTVCGRAAVGLLLEVLQPWGDVESRRVAYDTSGRVTGDWENSVTYASVVFWRTGEEEYLKRAEKKTLLRVARDVLKEFVEAHKMTLDEPRYDLTETLKKHGAAFVTLKNHGRLRGCIGTFVAQAPLYRAIAQMTCAAARDFRFRDNPVTSAELADIDIEISVLTPLEKVRDPLKEIELGRHGIYIEGQGTSGCFLPQVATETGWSLEEFLSHCAADKAGLAPDAWKKPGVTVYRFEAHVFGEKEEGRP